MPSVPDGSIGGARPQPPRGVVRATLSRAQAEDAATVLRVVSDATRLQILSLIMADPNGQVRVTELTGALGLRQPTVSHHLKVLTDSGVLAREPVGRDVWYHVVPSRLDAIADLLR